MNPKPPALLVVLIEAAELRWSVAGIDERPELIPLVQSEAGDLVGYLGLSFDEQVGFLRHRLAGAIQRGCDRLWGRQLKPVQFVLVQCGELREGGTELSQRIADHFCEWMVNPPTVFCLVDEFTPGDLRQLAGEIQAEHLQTIQNTLPALAVHARSPSDWEIVPARNRC